VGIRLNRNPPNISFRKKKTGGIAINRLLPLTHLDEKMVQRILQARGWPGGCTGRVRKPSCRSYREQLLLCLALVAAAQEYRIHNCDLMFKEDSTVDDLIDVIEGNRRYVKCECCWVI
jgi:ribosome-interacting GTPase 1